jgi:hypothetical protein
MEGNRRCRHAIDRVTIRVPGAGAGVQRTDCGLKLDAVRRDEVFAALAEIGRTGDDCDCPVAISAQWTLCPIFQKDG